MLGSAARCPRARCPGVHPSLVGIIVAGVLGNVAGSYIAWAVGRYAGQAAVRRWGRRVGIRAGEVDRATAWFERHGSTAVLVRPARPGGPHFHLAARQLAAMPPVRFGVYTTLGCIPWTAALAIAGYTLGANWQSVANGFHGPTYVIAGIVVVAIAAVVIVQIPPRQAAPRRHPGNPWAEHGEFAGARGTSADFRITSRPLSAASGRRPLLLPG